MTSTALDIGAVRRWRRYAEYIDIHPENLNKLPRHWRTSRLKFETRINPEVLDEYADADFELQYIDIGNVDSLGRINEKQTFRFEDAPSRARRRVRHGDVLISTVRTYLRAIAPIENPADNLIVSTGFAVLRPGNGYDSRFLWRLIQSNEFVDSVVSRSEGVGYPAINPGELGNLLVWLPPLPDQRAIVAFLDRETAHIDALIAHKERLIALLEEKRQAVISHAVTRGLDPSARLKDPGIPWLCHARSGWELTRLKFIADVQTGLTLGKDYRDCPLVERPYLRVANVQDGYLDLQEITTIRLPVTAVSHHELRPGDVLMTEGGDFDKLGRGYVWDGQITGCLHQNHIFAVRPSKRLRSHFLAALMTSSHGRNYFTFTSQQSTNLASTNATKLGNFPVPLPSIQEQDAILADIRERAASITTAVSRIRDGIARLHEYRTALISAAVTGQIDVRGEV